MIRTGEQYKDSIRDGRDIHINGEKVKDVTTHPQFKPLVDIRARIYDMQHDAATRDVMTVVQDGEVNAIGNALPYSQDDWWAKRRATDTVLETVGGVVTRVGDETVGEMWSLYDGQDVLSRSTRSGQRISRTTFIPSSRATRSMSRPIPTPRATAPRRRRTRTRTCCCTWSRRPMQASWCVARKYETAAAYANQAFTKPTIANWGNEAYSDYAVGFICNLDSPNLKFICRTGFSGRADARDYPLANKFDEVDTLVIFDNVLIPWENVLFYRHTKAAPSSVPRCTATRRLPSCSAT
jgi:4-hydroxyphenylacetate 3-monooxygenase